MNTARKFTDEQVSEIRAAYASGSLQHELAAQYSISRSTITKMVNGVTYQETFTGQRPKHGIKERLRKFTSTQVASIRQSSKTSANIKMLAALHNVARSTIWGIMDYRMYKELP